MPFQPSYTSQFHRDLKRMLRRGKDGGKIKHVMSQLIEQQPLEPRHHNHKLLGAYTGRRDCHVEPDWVLIYKLDREASRVIFERTGTHADLFR